MVDYLRQLQDIVRDFGSAGVLIVAATFIAVQFLLLPTLPLTIAAGLFFGVGGGFSAVMLGIIGGGSVNFLIARYVARDFVARKIARFKRFAAIDRAVEKSGWKLIGLLRLCPIPFGISNYAYGLTGVAFWPYLLVTVVAMAPGVLLFVTLGATATSGLEMLVSGERQATTGEYVLLGIGLLAGLAALVYIRKIAVNAIRRDAGLDLDRD